MVWIVPAAVVSGIAVGLVLGFVGKAIDDWWHK